VNQARLSSQISRFCSNVLNFPLRMSETELELATQPDVWAEVGRHVAPAALALAVRAAGTARSVAVSDGTDVAGLPDGRHDRAEGTEVDVRDGWVLTPASWYSAPTSTSA
jgi:N-acetylglucosamine-6-phosphate deacetylase